MKIIALGGLAGAGKDECAKALIADGWTHLKFADPIWECLIALDIEVFYRGCWIKLNGIIEQLGREEAKRQIPYVRRFLQRIGTEMGRGVFGEDFWVDHMRARIEGWTSDELSVVITDVRYQNEADLIGKLGGQVILIHRPGVTQGTHVSEALNFDHDREILNDGSIEELHAKLRRFA